MKIQGNLIKRTRREKNFTIIGNEILTRTDMGFEAKGLLCYILSLPDDWVVHKSVIQKEFKMGRRVVDRLFKEMECAGYVIESDVIKKNGQFGGKTYMFYDIPQKTAKLAKSTDVHLPTAAEPTAVNVHLLSTNTNKELIKENNSLSDFDTFSNNTVDEGEKLPSWLRNIGGSVSKRCDKFWAQIRRESAKIDGATHEVQVDLYQKYVRYDKKYPDFMRFETDRYFELNLVLRKFVRQQESYDDMHNY